MFKQAMAKSPTKSCDIVIANAGVSGADELYALEGEEIILDDHVLLKEAPRSSR
jgi:hypothetical protein